MKKTILLAAALLPGALLAQNEELTTDQYEVRRGERMGNCNGNKGYICEFPKTEKSFTFISKISSSQLRISIDVLNLTEEEQTGWLGKPLSEVRPDEELVFNQEYSVELNSELIRDLQLDPDSGFIAKGQHTIKLNGNKIELLLNLSDR